MKLGLPFNIRELGKDFERQLENLIENREKTK